LVNERLNNFNATVWYSEPILSGGGAQPAADLAAEIENGIVDTLIVLDCNPVYAGPGSLKLGEQIARVPNSIHAGLHPDETAQLCQWHVPLSHVLESWSDGRAVDESRSIIQPVLAPLYASRSIHQLVDLLLGTSATAADASVRATWRATFGS